jgi:uncharacterized membrane protein
VSFPLIALFSLGCLVFYWFILNRPPVAEDVVQRYLSKRGIILTPDNAALVFDYIAQVRRWRLTGLAVGAVLGTVVSLPEQGSGWKVDFGVQGMLTGWMVGAILAEWRYRAHTPGGELLGAAGRKTSWLLAWMAMAVVLLASCGVAVGHVMRHQTMSRETLLAFVVALFLAVAGGSILRRVSVASAQADDQAALARQSIDRQSQRIVVAALVVLVVSTVTQLLFYSAYEVNTPLWGSGSYPLNGSTDASFIALLLLNLVTDITAVAYGSRRQTAPPPLAENQHPVEVSPIG